MAVAIDSITTDKTTSTAGSVTFAHTVSGSDRVLYIACAFDDAITHTFADVTYNGVSATQIVSTELGTGRSIYLFRLIAPATGTNNVIIDWNGNFNSVSYLACSVTGALQTTPDTGTGSDEGTGTAISIPSIISNATDFVLGFGYLNNEAISDVTEGPGQTLEGNDDSTSGVIWCSSKAGAAGTQSLSWTVTSQSFSALGVSVAAASGATIDSTTDPVEDQVQNSITTTGLTGTPSATIGGASVDVTGSFPNLNYTIDIAGISGEESGPLMSSLVRLIVTGNEGSANADVTTQVKAGWAVTTLANPLNTGEGGVKKAIEDNSAKTVVAGDIIYYDTANNTSIATDGTITSDAATFDLKLGQGGDLTTPTTYTAFEVVFDESAIIEGLREFMSGIAVFDTLEEAQASNIAQNQVIFVTGESSINDGNAAFYLCTVGGTIQTAGAYPLVKITLS